MDAQPVLNPIVGLFPLIVFSIIAALIFLPIAIRKGVNLLLYFVLILIPGVSFFWIIYLASVTDREVKDRLKALEEK